MQNKKLNKLMLVTGVILFVGILRNVIYDYLEYKDSLDEECSDDDDFEIEEMFFDDAD